MENPHCADINSVGLHISSSEIRCTNAFKVFVYVPLSPITFFGLKIFMTFTILVGNSDSCGVSNWLLSIYYLFNMMSMGKLL